MTKLERTIELKPFTPINDFAVACDIKIVLQTIEVNFHVTGDLENLVIPGAKLQAERKDNLWESTCFELFVAEVGKKEYTEINVSPSGDWNAYSFSDYRSGMTPNKEITNIGFFNAQNLTELNVGFSVNSKIPKLALGISAVLKLNSGATTYWAYKHIGDKPDFHLRDTFLEV